MTLFSLLALSRFPLHSTRAVLRLIARIGVCVQESRRQAPARQILAAASVALVSLVPIVSLLTQQPLLRAQVPGLQTARARRQSVKPRAAGTQPGTANFSGN